MKIKLFKHHLDFFDKYLKKERLDLYEYLQNKIVSTVFKVDDEEKEVEISDWLGEILQTKGFKNNQEELNDEGKIIDELIERLEVVKNLEYTWNDNEAWESPQQTEKLLNDFRPLLIKWINEKQQYYRTLKNDIKSQ